MNIFSVSSCSTGAALGFIPLVSGIATAKITDIALPIINKLPESIAPYAKIVFNCTVFMGTSCGLAYLSSIPMATAITMMATFLISIHVANVVLSDPLKEENVELKKTIAGLQEELGASQNEQSRLATLNNDLTNQLKNALSNIQKFIEMSESTGEMLAELKKK